MRCIINEWSRKSIKILVYIRIILFRGSYKATECRRVVEELHE